jgi:hypothetical protein
MVDSIKMETQNEEIHLNVIPNIIIFEKMLKI